MSRSKAYIAIDVHARHSVVGWRNGHGEWQGSERCVTSEKEIIDQVDKIPAQEKHLTVEESTLAGWVARTMHPHVAEVVVCDPRHNESVHRCAYKNDNRDVEELTRLLWLGELKGNYHPQDDARAVFKSLMQQYLDLRDTQVRLKLQLKSKYHRWGITQVDGDRVYSPKQRHLYLDLVTDPSIRNQLLRLYALLDEAMRQQADAVKELQERGRAYPEIAEFSKIPGVGVIGSHLFDAFIQSPERFPDKSTLWRYCQLAVTERSSDQKPLGFRRLDRQGNPELKAMSYWAWNGSLRTRGKNEVKQFYYASLDRTKQKTSARLNTQRKILATMWAIWRKGDVYRPERFLSPADAVEC